MSLFLPLFAQTLLSQRSAMAQPVKDWGGQCTIKISTKRVEQSTSNLRSQINCDWAALYSFIHQNMFLHNLPLTEIHSRFLHILRKTTQHRLIRQNSTHDVMRNICFSDSIAADVC